MVGGWCSHAQTATEKKVHHYADKANVTRYFFQFANCGAASVTLPCTAERGRACGFLTGLRVVRSAEHGGARTHASGVTAGVFLCRVLLCCFQVCFVVIAVTESQRDLYRRNSRSVCSGCNLLR